MTQSVNISKLPFTIEDLLTPFSTQAKRFGEGAEEFDDLRDVVVVFAVFGAGLGVEQVVASYEFEDLYIR